LTYFTPKRGEDTTYAWKGYLGAGAAVLTAEGAFITADKTLKHFTGEGIIDRGRLFRRSVGSEETIDKSSNYKNSKPNADIGEKTVSKHDKTPSINSRMHNSNIKIPETKTWYKEIGKSFAKTKAGKTLGIATGLVGFSSVAGAAESEYRSFGAENDTMPQKNVTSPLSAMDSAVIMGTATVGNVATSFKH